jgi:long-chain fatty acid transport protein
MMPRPPRRGPGQWVVCLLVACAGIASLARDVRAAGFQVNEQSARGLGSSFAGEAAAAEDPSTIFFNPAGMTRLSGTQFLSSGFAIWPNATFHNEGSHLTPAVGGGALSGGNDNGGALALLQTLFISHELLTDRAWIGLGASTPYGLKTRWTPDWVGRYHAIDSQLLTVNVNPSLALKLMPWLSIGGGADVEYAKARLTNALDLGTICQEQAPRFGLPPQACVLVAGLRPQRNDGFTAFKGDDWNASYNVGVLFTPLDTTRIGLSYRAYTHHRFEGSADFVIPKKAAVLQRLSGALVKTNGNAAINLPDRVALSAFHQLTLRWALLADVTWTHWSQFDQLVFNFDNPKQPTIVQPERWNDSFRYSLGTRWDPSRRWSVRLGAAYDETPIPDATHRTARIPDSDRIWASFGVGFRFSDRLRFDLGYAHLFALDSSTQNPDPISHNVQVGSYTAHADIVGLGLKYDLGWPLWPPWGHPL